MPDGVPRYIRCYDNGGESLDRYTVVFTNIGRANKSYRGRSLYLAMNAAPFHPQGIGQHGEHVGPIDRPGYRHLGKKIRFADLPEDCKSLVIGDYKELWSLV